MKLLVLLRHYYHYLAIFSWQDSIELLFFILLFYFIVRLLSQDKTKNLLPYLYGYTAILGTAHYAQLGTIKQFLIVCFPGLCYLLALIHEKTLQRNLMTLTTSKIRQNPADWSLILISACLKACHGHHNVICLIERHDNLAQLTTTQYHLDIPIEQISTSLLLTHPDHIQTQMIHISNGLIRGINVVWQPDLENSATLFQTTQKYSKQLDFFLFSIALSPIGSINCIAIYNGSIVPDLTTQQLINLLRKHMNKTTHLPIPPLKGKQLCQSIQNTK